jgi:hypothetical protein
MDFNTFPVQWGWVALVLGGVALFMAVSPFLQMYFGRPKIKIEFIEDTMDGAKFLACQLSNPPLVHPIARFLGLHRESAEDLWVGFEIREDKTERVVVPVIVPELNRQGFPPTTHIHLPSSTLIARFPVVFCRLGSKEVKLADKANPVVLPPGQYIVAMAVMVSEKSVKVRRRFTIHTDGYFRWHSN